MPEMLPPLPSDAQGRAILLLAPSARADLDDLQCLAARLYLDSLRREGRSEPEVILCDPEGALAADLPARLGLAHAPRCLSVEGLPPCEPLICPPAMPMMTRAMLSLEWVRSEAISEVVTVDLSGVGFYLALALRQGLLARPVDLTVIDTGGAKSHDFTTFRYPDFAEIGLYHMEAETTRRAARLLQPSLGIGSATTETPTRLLFLLADSGLVALDWIDRLLPRLTEAQQVEEVQFLRPGAPLTAAQKAKAAQAAGRIGASVRFFTSHGDRPKFNGATLAVIVGRGGAAGLLAHLAASWGLPLASAHPGAAEDAADGPFARLPKSPTLSAAAIDEALRAPLAVATPAWQIGTPAAAPVVPAPHDGPLVTVCLVTFNRPGMLREAIASLEAQTSTAFEVILVDDGSSAPDALAALDALEEPFARRGWRIIRKQNGYLGAARNTAAAEARTPYLLFMDDDNIAKPMMIERFLHAAQASGADVLTCFNDSFRQTLPDATGYNRPQVTHRRLFMGGAEGLAPLYNVLGDANALVRRSTFEAVGGFHEDYGVTHEDWEFFLTASRTGARLEVLPEALFYYRVADVSMTTVTQMERNLFHSTAPLLAGEGAPAGYFILRSLAKAFGFTPFETTKDP